MMYIAALFFGVATWMSNPIASGVFVFAGVISTAMWIRKDVLTLSNNQQIILNKIAERKNKL